MLEVSKLYFKYEEKEVLNNINFTLKKGQYISLIGESGCGKSTLLKLIYGLFEIENGEISWNGEAIKGPKLNLVPGEKNMKYLAQDFDLMRFHTVEENIGKFLSNQNFEGRQQRIRQLLQMVEMEEYAKVQPKYLSGGQQQRIALARVLAQEPEVLILDEPFSQIDNFRKNSLRRNLFTYLKDKNILCIIATHDYTDALSFSDEVLVMKNGKIIQKNNPKKVFDSPKDKYTANLFGDVNEIALSYFTQNKSDKKILVYPFELKQTHFSELKVEVLESYFKGNNFLIQAIYDDGFLFFESEVEHYFTEKVYLTIDSAILAKRI